MRKKQQNQIIWLVISIMMLMVLTGRVLAADQVSSSPSAAVFADVPDSFWGKQAIDTWSAHGIIRGDGVNFYPNGKITRAEMAVILCRLLGYNEIIANPYTDISPTDWYYDALIKTYAQGIMEGSFDHNGNRLARPNDPLTRGEGAVLFARVFSIQAGANGQSGFMDTDIPLWAMDAISAMEAFGYIKGKENGLFDPKASLTRAETLQILDNILKLYITKPGNYSIDVKGNVVINSPDVILKDMKISGNLYLAEGIGEGEINLTNVTVTGKTYLWSGEAVKLKIENSQLGILVIDKEEININEPQPNPNPETPKGNSGETSGPGDNQPTPTPPTTADEDEEDSKGGNISTY